MIPSSADFAQTETYRHRLCHVFAVALHRRFGWAIHLVLDQSEPFWTDPRDSDNYIPAVIHVYAVDPQGNAWDVSGVRALNTIAEDLAQWTTIGEHDSDDVIAESGLRSYVGSWSDDDDEQDEPIDRPLSDYADADVVEADGVAMRVLSALPGFPRIDAAMSPGV